MGILNFTSALFHKTDPTGPHVKRGRQASVVLKGSVSRDFRPPVFS